MKILVTGAEGFLGSYLIKYLSTEYHDISVFGTHFSQDINFINKSYLDITDNKQVDIILDSINPDIIIHAAGESNVDISEKEKEKSYNSIVKGTFNISGWCNKFSKKLVFISTNAVFSGEEAPYSETSFPLPISTYGQYKLIAEGIVEKLNHFNIVRLILLYGWNYNTRQNPVTFVINRLKRKETIYMVENSSYINPLYIDSCCEGICRVIKFGKDKEIYHLGGITRIDRYNLALSVAKVFDLDKNLIVPASNDYFKTITSRPYDTTYNILKALKEIEFVPLTLDEGLQKMKEKEIF